MQNIPTVQPVSTKAVFGAKEVQNTFETAIKRHCDTTASNFLKKRAK